VVIIIVGIGVLYSRDDKAALAFPEHVNLLVIVSRRGSKTPSTKFFSPSVAYIDPAVCRGALQ